MKRLAATLYAYKFFDDLILLYAVYPLLFSGTGLAVPEISSLFIIWSATGIVLEVPSGVLADAFSRRLLLSLGPLLRAAGFALWVLIPSYGAFALGFVLWGAQGALQSGAMEALVYEELDHLGAADRYVKIMGRAEAAGMVAVMTAITAASPALAAGGYPVVAAASVFASVLTAGLGAAFPEHRARRSGDGDKSPGYRATLRSGLAEARADRSLRPLLLMVAVTTAVWGGLEEYVSLLADETGVVEQVVPLLVLLVWVGVALGGLLAPFGSRMRKKVFAGVLAAAALALAAGALSGHPAGFMSIAMAFGVFHLASVVAGGKLQDKITGPSRATVTSLAGLGTDFATLLLYGAYAVASPLVPHRVVFAMFAMPYLVIAVGLAHGRRHRGSR